MLDKLRKKIDSVDKEIIKLLNERAAAAVEIGKIKSAGGGSVYMPEREKEVLTNVIRLSTGPLSRESVIDIYREILNSCRDLQKVFKIAYFGPEATFTHQAAVKNFGKKAVYINCQTISDVFEEVEKNRADYGVVPIENSNEGMVYHTLDMFKVSDLKIAMEINLNIHHYLISKAGSINKITKLYYFPHAYAQCEGWIKKNLKNVILCEALSTAESARLCVNDTNAAAIASQLASDIYRLNILAGPIEDYKQNVTRFLVICGRMPGHSGRDKTSIMFSIKDKIGALHDMLVPFKKNNINLTKIESRPTKQKAWNYVFYVDFQGHINDPKVKSALNNLEKKCSFLKILGSYPMGI